MAAAAAAAPLRRTGLPTLLRGYLAGKPVGLLWQTARSHAQNIHTCACLYPAGGCVRASAVESPEVGRAAPRRLECGNRRRRRWLLGRKRRPAGGGGGVLRRRTGVRRADAAVRLCDPGNECTAGGACVRGLFYFVTLHPSTCVHLCCLRVSLLEPSRALPVDIIRTVCRSQSCMWACVTCTLYSLPKPVCALAHVPSPGAGKKPGYGGRAGARGGTWLLGTCALSVPDMCPGHCSMVLTVWFGTCCNHED